MNTTSSETPETETLHPLEVRILSAIDSAEVFTLQRCMEVLTDNPGQAHQVVSWLRDRGYAQIESHTVATQYELTERGRDEERDGLLEERVVVYLREDTERSIPGIAAALRAEQAWVGSAVGRLKDIGVVELGAAGLLELTNKIEPPSVLLEKLSKSIRITKDLLHRAKKAPLMKNDLSHDEQKDIALRAKKRGAGNALFKITDQTQNSYRWTEKGQAAQRAIAVRGNDKEAASALTVDMLHTGEWKNKRFRKFNINIPPSRVLLGRTSTYSQFLREVKDKLVALGFSEFDGPLVESEFWNCDALFMPQFHSARDTHDVYYLQSPTHAKEIERAYLDPVAQTHEHGGGSGSSGWKYSFDTEFTRRLLLRSQGTALSAKQLRNAAVPGKYFGVVRCFRYDQIDSTHLSDFYQTEGIVLGEQVNLRTLLGLLRSFAVEIGGAEEVRFVPGYFPFTEPSIEVFVKHPQLGWFELGGAGIFRPEVTTPFGIDVPVLAWGLGVDRMALLKLKLNDLRQLFTYDIEKVRLQTE